MRATRIVLLALVLSGALAATSSALTSVSAGVHIGPSGRAAVDLGFFYDDLAPYGRWVQSASYGWVWSPRVTRAHWRPYLYGHWVWTDWGWTWVSDEPYGWACYHYGRWIDDASYGWEWVPGYDWGPSWVSWQEGGDYIGWAALPPAVDIRAGNFNVGIAPADFVFVPERQFLAPRIAGFAAPIGQVNTIFPRTRTFNNYSFANQRVFNGGVPVDRIQRAIGRTVPRFQVADAAWTQRRQERIAGNRVAMFRPQVTRASRVDPPPARPLARRSVVAASAAAAVRQQNAKQNHGQQIANERRFGQQGRLMSQKAQQNHGQQIASQRRFGQQGRLMSQKAQQNHGQQIASERRFGQQGRAMRQKAQQNHGQQIANERRFGQQGRAMRQNAHQNRGQQIRQERQQLRPPGRQAQAPRTELRQHGRPQRSQQHPQNVAPMREQRPAVERRQRQGPPPQRMMAQPRPQREMRQPRVQQGGPPPMRAERAQRQGPPPQRMMAQPRQQPRPQPQANPNRGRGGPGPGQHPNRDRNKPPGQG